MAFGVNGQTGHNAVFIREMVLLCVNVFVDTLTVVLTHHVLDSILKLVNAIYQIVEQIFSYSRLNKYKTI